MINDFSKTAGRRVTVTVTVTAEAARPHVLYALEGKPQGHLSSATRRLDSKVSVNVVSLFFVVG